MITIIGNLKEVKEHVDKYLKEHVKSYDEEQMNNFYNDMQKTNKTAKIEYIDKFDDNGYLNISNFKLINEEFEVEITGLL